MKSRKYVDDYRLDNVYNKKGKLVTVPVYNGPLFDFVQKKERIKKTKIRYLIFGILEIVFFFLPLFLPTPTSHIFYISFPYCLIIFFLLGQGDATFTLLTLKEKIIRSQKDKIEKKLTMYIFLIMIFSLMSLIGHVVHWIIMGETLYDIIYLICTFLVCALAFSLFITKEDLKMEQLSKEDL